MKLVKMSLAAAVLLGASAFAIDNVKVSGDAKLFYSTTDAGNVDLFDAASTNSAGNAALRVAATADLTKGVSAGATVYAITTLGLENNLVSNVWEAGLDSNTLGNAVSDNWWMGELWMAGTVGKTTVKVGRMELDTPLAFTEKWSIVPNTFEAIVGINQDLPDTTLVAAYVGKSNGSFEDATPVVTGIGGVTKGDKKFDSFRAEGAYAFGLVNNSIKPVTFQAWYYDVVTTAKAYWLQADWDCQLAKGVKLGAQYADNDLTGSASAFALKAAYTGVPGLMVSAAYSDVEKGTALVGNVATANGQSKMYTESWWTFGKVGASEAQSFNLTGEYDAGIAKVGAYYTNVNGGTAAGDLDEVALTASKSFGPLDATLAYISTENGTADQANTVQAYLTLNF